MNRIPTGLVTFLFTDVEGSTKLAQEFPETLLAALDRHHSIIQKAVVSNAGFVFKTVGDAFCCAFENADDAVKTAVNVQTNLADEKWDNVIIKVRMGIHSGNAEWNGDRYMGYMTLARTSRVMSAAYGEQILVSKDTYELIRNEISFRDLGERRLKDVIQPIRLFQIVSPGLRDDFPPLKTLDARPNNLPIQLTNFIGREDEMKTIRELIKQTRLLSLIGTGGAGKTRLALQIAADIIDDFANGVWLVELASLSDPAFLPQAIMKVFELKEEQKKSSEETLCDYLKDKEMLIILDNCEHLIEVCAKLTQKLLRNCPQLKILPTSREVLRCEGEQTHRISSLEVPDPKEKNSPEKLSQYEAVRLFIERALAVDKSFRINNQNAPSLAEICYQLDGIPLAIELAAARIKVLTVEKIHERLNDRFNLLTGGKRTALPRQQTLRALTDWSYDLLSEKEKILWRRLSVFAGGCTLEAAEEICSDEKINKTEILELLDQLSEKSIIIYDANKERYRLLETLKKYGEEKLKEAKEEKAILNNHLLFYKEFSEKADHKLRGSEMHLNLEKLDKDIENIHSAIEWSIIGDKIDSGALLARSLKNYWKIRGLNSIGRQLVGKFLLNTHGLNKSSLADIFLIAGILSYNQGDYEQSEKYLKDSLKLFQEINDKKGIADSLHNLGNVALFFVDHEHALKLYEESLVYYRGLNDKIGIASSLNNLGRLANIRGDYKQSKRFYEESLTLKQEMGDLAGAAFSLNNLGNVEYTFGNYETAQKYYTESITLNREIGNKNGTASSLINLGNIANNNGDYEQARKYYEESLSLNREMGNKNGIAMSLNNLGIVEINLGSYEKAHKIFGECIELRRIMEDKEGLASSLNNFGNVAYRLGNLDEAQKFFKKSLVLTLEIGDLRGLPEAFVSIAELLTARSNLSIAILILGAVDAYLTSTGLAMDKAVQTRREQIIKGLREKSGDEEFLKYFEQGKKLSLEKAADLILNCE